ncbi:hypothetical protein CEXT_392961 [Caerostris extrusa]|uniref:Uncharacterized protein n=1 Tax=Caerostris extrusa TaxID=172846 RepID=A0AAV4VKW7_CAEEX|nr:hypothetical protein CEXT_392961 [Caerostris extrusa]
MAPGLFALLHSLPCLLYILPEFAYEAANKANFSTLPNKMKLSEESERESEEYIICQRKMARGRDWSNILGLGPSCCCCVLFYLIFPLSYSQHGLL